MQIAIRLIRGDLSESTIRRGTMIEYFAVCSYNRRKETFIYVSCWEVSFAEIRALIVVIQIQFHRLGNLIIYPDRRLPLQPRVIK